MSALFGLRISEETRKRLTWEKALVVPTHGPNHARKVAFGLWIVWSDYGNRNSGYGWEIDHTVPTVLGGGSGLDNLRALHWRNNAAHGGSLSRLGR